MKNYIEKFKNVLPFTFIFYVMFGMLAPLEIYAGNVVDFEFGFHDFFWMFLGIYGIIWLVGTAILAFIPKKILDIINVLLATVAIECYLQYAFFNKQLSMAGGANMNWEALKAYSIVNLIAWIVIAVVVIGTRFLLKDKWMKFARYIMLFLIAIQLVAVISLVIQVPKSRVFEYECKIDATKQMAVAPGENIIVFVLDGYSNERFDYNMEINPEIKEVLKDFTYYNNANSIYEATDYCMNIVLTGQLPDDSDEAWRSNCWEPEKVSEFYNILHKHGYECLIASRDTNNVYGEIKALSGKFDNVYDLEVALQSDLLFRLFTKMTIYKYLPYVLKPPFEVMYYAFQDVIASVHYDESVYLDPLFYQKMLNDRMYVDDSMENMFKVQHIQGMHPDYNMDENANQIDDSMNNLESHTKGLNCIIDEYLNCLKECGAYDNATVIIMADHGDAFEDYAFQPLVLIKRPSETHAEMVVNSAPISHYDFIPTILSFLGEDYSEFASGTSIYDWKEGDRRERTVNVYGLSRTYYYNRDELFEIRENYKREIEEKRKELGL